jgi:hypothetical protein
MKSIFYLLLFVSFPVLSQITGVVKDEFGKTISYASISVENENLGVSSDENGAFSIALKEHKNLLISAMGFETKKVSSAKVSIITLKEKPIVLDEVILQKKENLKREIKGLKKHNYFPEPWNYSWVFVKHFSHDASEKQINFLKEATFFTKSKIDNAIFKVRIYRVKADGSPGDDLLSDDLIVTVKKGKNASIVDLSKFNIMIPKEGIFVGFENLVIERNKFERVFKNKTTKEETIYAEYQPSLGSDFLDEARSYIFGLGEWVGQGKSKHSSDSNKETIIAPAINLILTN